MHWMMILSRFPVSYLSYVFDDIIHEIFEKWKADTPKTYLYLLPKSVQMPPDVRGGAGAGST